VSVLPQLSSWDVVFDKLSLRRRFPVEASCKRWGMYVCPVVFSCRPCPGLPVAGSLSVPNHPCSLENLLTGKCVYCCIQQMNMFVVQPCLLRNSWVLCGLPGRPHVLYMSALSPSPIYPFQSGMVLGLVEYGVCSRLALLVGGSERSAVQLLAHKNDLLNRRFSFGRTDNKCTKYKVRVLVSDLNSTEEFYQTYFSMINESQNHRESNSNRD